MTIEPDAGADTPDPGSEPELRWRYRVLVVIAISPIVVAAVRNGLAGWQPTLDAAISTVRIRDVFSAHPPLVGLAAQTSFEASDQYSYLGALPFYLLAAPVRLFGVTWGLLLGKAAIDASLVVTALWLVRRRVGVLLAMVAAAFVTSLLWTVGSQVLIEPTPVAVGIVPLFVLLIAAWAAADGDRAGLVVVCAVGNYLVQAHPKFIVVVPLVCLYAATVWSWTRVRARRSGAAVEADRRRDRWVVAGCALFTVVVWLPPAFDQFRAGGGNLGKAARAALSGQTQGLQTGDVEPTFSGALGVLASVTAVPPGWLPPNFAEVPFDRSGGGTPFLVGLLATLVLVGLLAHVVRRARRRGDRTVSSAVGVGVVAWIGYLVTAMQNPDAYGFRARYFYGLWPLGAYLWLVVVIGLVRAHRSTIARSGIRTGFAAGTVVVVTTVVAILAWPRADHAEVPSAPLVGPAAAVRSTVAAEFDGSGPVLVEVDFSTSRLWPAVLLGLQDAGVPIRVAGPIMVQQFGGARDVTVHRDATRALVLRDASMAAPDDARAVAVFTTDVRLLSEERFADATAKVRRWAASSEPVRINPELTASKGMHDILDAALATLTAGDPTPGELVADPVFLGLLVTAQPFLAEPVFAVPGMDARELADWATDALAATSDTVLYEVPSPG